jgi:hypothetical protein
MKGLPTVCPQQAEAGREVLSSLFLRTIYMFFIGLTFGQEFTLSPANLNVNFRAAFSFIANEVTHLSKSPFD